MSNLTVLFVTGSWHSPKHFQPAREAFESAGYPTECPCLPTFDAKVPVVKMYEDAACIRSVLDKLVETERKDVICVLHSYGGMVGTEGIHESLGKNFREAKSLDGGVLGILYMAAFVLPLGTHLGTAFGGPLPPFIRVEDDGYCNMTEPERRFYNDLSKKEQDHWVSELRPQPAIAQLTPLTYTAYKHHPVVYLYCENDEAISLEIQKNMVQSSGVDFKTETCTAGHSPFLSQISNLIGVVERMAA